MFVAVWSAVRVSFYLFGLDSRGKGAFAPQPNVFLEGTNAKDCYG